MSALPTCSACRDGTALPVAVSMAFQPIVQVSRRTIYAHEALVRGTEGQSAASVLATVTDSNRYAFDQVCRTEAIATAARIGLDTRLSINFMPNAVYKPAHCLRATVAACQQHGRGLDTLIFEVSEQEAMLDPAHLLDILQTYRELGPKTAIDDFGAGHSGLNLLADFTPDLVKLDMHLIRDIHTDRKRQAIARHLTALCAELGIEVVAEGIECEDESKALSALGIDLQQGYLFARPLLRGIPPVHWPH
ncbi:EAL domain-containing protein [Pseudoxanthomonas sp. JBR18]|uniref:EAL domain-containing protein n=1 Tax=Pseudoxanthomonas sp. JBR18 TaxID=2969308 RepID=UPI0023054823|nr:EAL domain-containing protein [Pseudoxanthomonas sp. JBR18]WCE04039.1 EAL domain-containing protein [Pseudoxanthomonas sp. JBR18]